MTHVPAHNYESDQDAINRAQTAMMQQILENYYNIDGRGIGVVMNVSSFNDSSG